MRRLLKYKIDDDLREEISSIPRAGERGHSESCRFLLVQHYMFMDGNDLRGTCV